LFSDFGVKKKKKYAFAPVFAQIYAFTEDFFLSLPKILSEKDLIL